VLTHGSLTVTFEGGTDEAGNPVPVIVGTLVNDVGAPPAPQFDALLGDYNLGTQLKWNAFIPVDGVNTPQGAKSGKIFYVAVDDGKPGPASVSFDSDGNPLWVMPDDPASTTTPKAKVAIRQSGLLTTGTSGTTGTSFSAFSPDGTFDVYAIFVSTTGNVSAITVTPQLDNLVMN
jgi:hypothetical protein